MSRLSRIARTAALKRGGYAVVRTACKSVIGQIQSQLWSFATSLDCRPHAAPSLNTMGYESVNPQPKPSAYGLLVQV
jgi:hypothetical protein